MGLVINKDVKVSDLVPGDEPVYLIRAYHTIETTIFPVLHQQATGIAKKAIESEPNLALAAVLYAKKLVETAEVFKAWLNKNPSIIVENDGIEPKIASSDSDGPCDDPTCEPCKLRKRLKEGGQPSLDDVLKFLFS